jgi:hypothetical protein
LKIQIDLSALHDTKWNEYAVRLLFGGLTCAAAGIIARSMGPVVGGLFLAFPAIFPASATLIAKHEKEKKVRAGQVPGQRGKNAVALDAQGCAMGSIGLVTFALVVWQLLPRHSTWSVLAAATLVWAGISVAMWSIVEYL